MSKILVAVHLDNFVCLCINHLIKVQEGSVKEQLQSMLCTQGF